MARLKLRGKDWTEPFEISVMLVGLMAFITVLDWLLPIDLRAFGILPRTIYGIVGIAFAPLLHLGFPHLVANALPLMVLLVLTFGKQTYRPKQTLTWIWLGSGLGTWLIGRGDSIHIGASSLIYGLVVYLVASGWWMRNWHSVLVAVVVLILYGGIFYGVLPQRGSISWEGHLAGAIAGFLVARYYHG